MRASALKFCGSLAAPVGANTMDADKERERERILMAFLDDDDNDKDETQLLGLFVMSSQAANKRSRVAFVDLCQQLVNMVVVVVVVVALTIVVINTQSERFS